MCVYIFITYRYKSSGLNLALQMQVKVIYQLQ